MTSSWYSNPGPWSYGIAAIAFAWVAVRLISQWSPGGKPAMLLAMVTSTAFAAASATVFAVKPSLNSWWAAWAFDLLRSAATLGFLLAFLGVRDHSKGAQRGGKGWALLVAVALVLVLVQLLFGIKAPGVPDLDLTVHKVGFASALAIAVFGLVLAEQCYRRTPAGTRWHVRPLLLGIAGVLAFDFVLYADALLFRILDPDLWSSRGLVLAVTVPLFILTLQRTRDWSFELSVSRGVLAGSTALLAAGAYLVLISGAGLLLREFGGSWGRALESALVFAALLLLAAIGMSATFRAKVRVLVAKNFFSYRYDYRQEWLRFTNTLGGGSALQPWAACLQALGDLVESPGGALWLQNVDGSYLQVVHSNLPADPTAVAQEDSLPVFLRQSGWVLEISDVIAMASKYQGLKLPPSIAGVREAWLIVPLLTARDLVGFVVLSEPRVRIDLDWEVLDLLKTAGRQAVSWRTRRQPRRCLKQGSLMPFIECRPSSCMI